MSTVLGPAKITVEFDVAKAKRDLEAIEKERRRATEGGGAATPPGTAPGAVDPVQTPRPSDPRRPTPSDATGPAGRDPTRPVIHDVPPEATGLTGRIGQTWQAGRGLLGAARGGSLSYAVTDLAGTAAGALPVAGPLAAAALKGTALAEEYGPAVAAAIEAAAPDALRGPLRSARGLAEDLSRGLAKLRAPLDALGATADAVQTVAGGLARLRGEVNSQALLDYARPLYDVQRTLSEAQRIQTQIRREAAGEALGKLAASALAGGAGN